MLHEQNHIIQTHVFEVGFPDRERATDLQNRLSRLFNTRLSEVMSGLFDKHIPNDLLVKIDKLEVDLGAIPYSQFEDELAERFVRELEKELRDRLVSLKSGSVSVNPVVEATEFKAGFIDLLEYFLVNGSMPWWASGSSTIDHEEFFRRLLSEDPAAVRQMLLKAGQNANVRRRLVYRFSETLIRSVIDLLEPEEAVFIFEYYRDVLRLQQEQELVRNESSGFEKEVLVFILSAIVVDRGSLFNKKMFVKSTLGQMAAHYSISYESLLFLFSSTLEQNAEQVKKTDHLPVIILELFSEHLRSREPEPTGETAVPEKKTNLQERTEVLRHYLFLGSVPSWSAARELEELRQIFSELLDKTPLLVRGMLAAAMAQQGARSRLMKLSDEGIFNRIVRSLETNDPDFIVTYAAVFAKFLAKVPGVETTDIERHARELILTFLVRDKSSVFEKQALLQTTIRQAARQYDKPFATLLVYLIQFMSEKYTQENDTELFHLITRILKEERITHDDDGNFHGLPAINEAQKDPELTAVLLRDALSHFLQHGYPPWWSEDLGGSPEKMLNDLIRKSPEDALLLLKLSGTATFARQRFLSQFSPETILNLFKRFKDGGTAEKLFQALERFTETSIIFNSRDGLKDALLSALWQTYETENYLDFKTPVFVEKALAHLAFKTNISSEKIVKAFNQQVRDINVSGLDAAPAALPNSEDVIQEGSAHLTEIIKSTLPDNHKLDKTLLLTTALNMLSYFLTWNKLPPQLEVIDRLHEETILRQIFVLLSAETPATLKDLMRSAGRSSMARMRIHGAMTMESNTAERNARTLLSEFSEPDILQYFREHGLLAPIHGTELRKLLDAALEHDSPAEKREILRFILNDVNLTRTLAWQFAGEKFYDLLQQASPGIDPGTVDLLKGLQDLLGSAITDTLEREKTNALFKEFSLYFFSRQNPDTRSSGFLSAFFKFLAARRYPVSAGLFTTLLDVSARVSPSSSLVLSGHLDEIRRQLRLHITFENRTNAVMSDLKRSEQQALAQLGGIEINEDPKQNGTDEQSGVDEPPERKQVPEDLREKIYIQNAGLVLLHPFISTVFKRAGLTENGKFLHEAARHRAVYLLQYLVYGANTYAEHEMVLNKVLCGIPLPEPLLPGLTPSANEIEIAEGLLREIPRQWDKLKNTSVAGFQASFLQRNGVLSHSDESWSMKVEQRGYDVLLQTLPWSFGMIKTPWMDKFLYVEWT